MKDDITDALQWKRNEIIKKQIWSDRDVHKHLADKMKNQKRSNNSSARLLVVNLSKLTTQIQNEKN